MILRRLFALLIGLAMALAPLGMPAMAQAAPDSHHDLVMKQGHCDEQPAPDHHGRAASDKDCCVAMCIAVVAPSGAADLPDYHPARARPASDLDRRGFLGEIATPPPRLA